MRAGGVTAALLALLLPAPATGARGGDVASTLHNLSVSGPGEVRAVAETEVCRFCHVPHRAVAATPLWGHALPAAGGYRTAALRHAAGTPAAAPQPDGSSRLCLSCHDGTVALGDLTGAGAPVAMAGAGRLGPGRRGHLGTDLSGSHPVSFVVPDGLPSGGDGDDGELELRPLAAIAADPDVRLDARGRMQCTTCHDPHADLHYRPGEVPRFWVKPTVTGVCQVCHDGPVDPHLDPGLVPAGCRACHRGHGVSGSPMLAGPQRRVCLSCHGGAAESSPGGALLGAGARPPSLAADLAQPYRHPLHDAAYSRHEPGAVTCTSCHSPHRSPPPAAGGRPRSPRDPSRLQVGLCLSCHGGGGDGVPGGRGDVGERVDPRNRSYHPLLAPAPDPSSSLPPGLSGGLVECTSCHGNATAEAGGGAAGVHGSPRRHLLRAAYAGLDGGAESPAAYALCYRCHRRGEVLGDGSPFPLHRLHVVERRASCATCHDPHGSPEARALVRFADLAGVTPSATTGRLEFRSTAPGRGVCSLTCHGADHGPRTYGALGAAGDPAFTDSW